MVPEWLKLEFAFFTSIGVFLFSLYKFWYENKEKKNEKKLLNETRLVIMAEKFFSGRESDGSPTYKLGITAINHSQKVVYIMTYRLYYFSVGNEGNPVELFNGQLNADFELSPDQPFRFHGAIPKTLNLSKSSVIVEVMDSHAKLHRSVEIPLS